MKVKNLILFFFLLVCASPKAFSYDAVGRLQLIEDRYKIQENLRAVEDQFLLDSVFYLSGDFTALMDDIDRLSTADSNEAQLFSELADKWEGSEFGGRAFFQFGTPSIDMDFGNMKLKTEVLRVRIGLTMNMGIVSEVLTAEDIANFIPSDQVTPEIVACISQINFATINANDTLATVLQNQNICRAEPLKTVLDTLGADITFTAEILTLLQGGSKVPNMSLYTKADAKLGPRMSVVGENYNLSFNLYGLARMDYSFLISQANAENLNDVFDPPTKPEEINLAIDAKATYIISGYRLSAGIEELKLLELNKDDEQILDYESPILLSFLADKTFRPFENISVRPFLGFYKREGYDLSEGAYVGGDASFLTLEDKLRLRFRTQLDIDHLTFAPAMKFYGFNLEAMYRLPIREFNDNVKNAAAYSLNLRVAF